MNYSCTLLSNVPVLTVLSGVVVKRSLSDEVALQYLVMKLNDTAALTFTQNQNQNQNVYV